MTAGIIFTYVLVFIGSYVIGSVPWGYLIGKLHGKDIRQLGSGNIGATNVTRVIGPFSGKICFALDLLKGFFPVLIVSIMIQKGTIEDYNGLIQIIAALGAVIGHIFSIFLKFKGGKGISTSAGALLAMAPPAFLISGVVWVVVFLLSRYVSLASIAAAAVLPVSATFISLSKLYPISPYILIFLYILAAVAILRHTSNIKRLLNGTENRFDKKKKGQEEVSDENNSSK